MRVKSSNNLSQSSKKPNFFELTALGFCRICLLNELEILDLFLLKNPHLLLVEFQESEVSLKHLWTFLKGMDCLWSCIPKLYSLVLKAKQEPVAKLDNQRYNEWTRRSRLIGRSNIDQWLTRKPNIAKSSSESWLAGKYNISVKSRECNEASDLKELWRLEGRVHWQAFVQTVMKPGTRDRRNSSH